MRKINELGIGAFRPDTSINGAHKGIKNMMSPTADADSLFSRNMQRLAYENEDIEEEEILTESSAYEMIYRLLVDLMLAGIDFGEWGGAVMFIPRLSTNIVQLMTSNYKAKNLLKKEFLKEKDIKNLEKIRSNLGRDVVDVFTTIITLFPFIAMDNILDILLTQLSDKTSKFIADIVIRMIDSIENKLIKNIFYIGGLPFGGPIILTSLRLIQEIDERLFAIENKKNNLLTSDDSDVETIDITPNEVNEAVLSCRVKIGRKYKLVETLDNLNEFPNYIEDYRIMADKINNQSKERLSTVKSNELDEMSVGGVPGVGVPMGYTSKGKPETPSQRKKRQKFNREKSFPYK